MPTLKRNANGEFSAQKFKDALWQPAEPIHVNRDKIVFWAYLAPTSPLVQIIEGKTQAAPEPKP